MSFDSPDTNFSFEADPFGPVDTYGSHARRAVKHAVRYIPLVANDQVQCMDEVIERLCAVWVSMGRHPLIVDAGPAAPLVPAASALGLNTCIQTYAPQVSYLPAGGLPRRHVDAHGSAASLLKELQRAAPYADLVLVHADATDLARIFKHRQAQPLLVAEDDPESLKQAYAGWKWLGLRCGWVNAQLIVARSTHERAGQLAQALAGCAEQFMDAALTAWAPLASARSSAPGANHALKQLAAAQLGQAMPSRMAGHSRANWGLPSLDSKGRAGLYVQ